MVGLRFCHAEPAGIRTSLHPRIDQKLLAIPVPPRIPMAIKCTAMNRPRRVEGTIQRKGLGLTIGASEQINQQLVSCHQHST